MAWRTKEDVLKDLAEVAGTIRNEDLDESYLVVGNAPPPVRREDASEEMRLLFGEAHTQTDDDYWPESRGPDVEGITAMLRMVEAYENQNDENSNNDSGDCVITISKVSNQLNPYVEEFKPKAIISPYSRELELNKNIYSDVLKQNVEVTEESKKATVPKVKGKESGDNNEIELGLNFDKIELEDEATSLKNQISDAAKSDSFEFKKQRNVAIATLLKLYAKNNPSPTKVAAPVKLIKPNYFEGKAKNDLDVKTKSPLNIVSIETYRPQSRDSSTTSRSTFSPRRTPTNPTASPKLNISPEIKQSIDKVSRWLEEPKSPNKVKSPSKAKAPPICLGPITFKRRDNVAGNAAVTSTGSSQKVEIPSDQTPQYQPTQYAAELAQKYQERNKLLEAKKKEVNWTNLEEVLKAKDLEIKKRLAQQEQQDQEEPSTSGL